MTRVGVISDTHGVLRPEAVAFLQGSARIVHAGDVGDPQILDRLSEIAPVTAVRGNNDKGRWAAALAHCARVQVEEIWICAIHDISDLDIDPLAEGVRVVVSGHSHKPKIEERAGVLYVNPGSAGPRRFKLPIAVAELEVLGGSVRARIVELA